MRPRVGAAKEGGLLPLLDELEWPWREFSFRLRTGEEDGDDGLAFRLVPVPGMWLEAVRSTLGLRSTAGFASSFFFVVESSMGDCRGELFLELGEKLEPLPRVGVEIPEASLARSLASMCAFFSSSTFFSRASASGFLQ